MDFASTLLDTPAEIVSIWSEVESLTLSKVKDSAPVFSTMGAILALAIVCAGLGWRMDHKVKLYCGGDECPRRPSPTHDPIFLFHQHKYEVAQYPTLTKQHRLSTPFSRAAKGGTRAEIQFASRRPHHRERLVRHYCVRSFHPHMWREMARNDFYPRRHGNCGGGICHLAIDLMLYRKLAEE